MTAFDATIQVGGIQVFPVGEKEADDKYTEAQMLLGIMATAPVGPGQLLPIPFGGLRVPLDLPSINDLISELQKTAEQLKERVDIPIASSLAGVERAAAQEQKLRNG